MSYKLVKTIIISVTVLIVIGLVILGFFIGENPSKILRSSIEKRVVTYETDITDSIANLNSTEKFRGYLENWAQEKGVDYKIDGNTVIMSRKAAKLFEDLKPTVIICSYDIEDLTSSINPIAVAFTVLKVDKELGDVKVIFTSDSGRTFEGAKNLNPSYIPENSRVFTLTSGKKNMYSLKSGGSSSYNFTKEISYDEPRGNKAFKISITGASGGFPDTKISYHPNPVKELGSLLAKFQGSSMVFDLASFSGGSSANVYPDSAVATVVIDEEDVDKFNEKMERYIESFKEEFNEIYPDVTLTFEETSLPEKVISKDDVRPLYSLLYTLFHGIYYKNENGDVISIASINYVDTDADKIVLKTMAASLWPSNLKEIDNALSTLSGLSEFDFEKTDSGEFWNSEENQISHNLALAYKSFNARSLEFVESVPSTIAPIISAKQAKSQVINVTITTDSLLKDAGALITFMTIKSEAK